jgi:hypothetical protein
VLQRSWRWAGAPLAAAVCGAALLAPSAGAAGAEQSVYRMNAGGPAVTDSIGRQWRADEHFAGGAGHAVTNDIGGTDDDVLFQSERWGMTGYDIPTGNGAYTLQLLLAEINPTSGPRVFSVTGNGAAVLTDYSISDHVGAYRANVVRAPVTVTDGMLRLRFTAQSNSASVAGIELLSADPGPTDPGPTDPPVPGTPSGQPMPVGNLLGSVPGTAYGPKWTAYQEGWTDTSGNGTYSPGRTLSTANGMLDIFLHTEGGTHLVSAPQPKLPNVAFGQTYGRYTVRFKADAVPGYKTAWLLWPDTDQWPDGEIDFPEGNLDGEINAFSHHTGNPTEQDGFSTTARYPSWHTATTEWSPGRVTFILDGTTIGSTTTLVPTTAMHYVLQTETCLETGCEPADSAAGHVSIDWVAIYARA